MNDSAFSYTHPAPQKHARQGILCGAVIAVQPTLSVRGWPASAGSRALKGFIALEDATVVERLHSAGARIAGYTHIAELGLGLEGDTGALTVASSECDAALLTDTLGEARVAAAEARLCGFKPTGGTVSRYGLIGLVPSMECLGVVARDVDTIRRVVLAISGPDERDFSLGDDFPDFSVSEDADNAPTAAVTIRQSVAGLNSAEMKGFEASLAALERTGVTIREASVDGFELFRTIHQAIGAVETSSSAGKYDGVRYGHRAAKADNWNEMYLRSREESFGSLVKAFLFQGAYFQFKNYPAFENACRIRRRLVEALQEAMSGWDVFLLPTRRSVPEGGRTNSVPQIYDRFALTLAANVAGLPSVSLPHLVSAEGNDLGLQIIANGLEDTKLLGYAAKILSAKT